MNLSFDLMNHLSGAHYGLELTPSANESTAPAGGPDLQADPAVSEQRPPRAATPELNRLMRNISRETYAEVTSGTLTKLSADTAALDKAGRDAIRNLAADAQNAQSALEAIGRLTVSDILGNNSHVRRKSVEDLFGSAADRQFALSEKLRELASSPKYAAAEFAEYRHMLNELSLKCDSRASEIMTLYMEVMTFGERQAIGGRSEFAASKAGDLIRGMAGSMHGNDKVLGFKEEVEGIEASLASLSADAPVDFDEVDRLLEKTTELGRKLKDPDAAGIQAMDADIRTTLTAHLDALRTKLDTLVDQAVLRSVNSVFRQAGSVNELGREIAAFVAARPQLFPSLHNTMSTLCRICDHGIRNHDEFVAFQKCMRDPALGADIEAYLNDSSPGKPPLAVQKEVSSRRQLLLGQIGYPNRNLHMASRIGKEIFNRHKDWGAEQKTKMTGEDVLNAFRRNDRLSVILQTRIHGANEEDVEPWLSDRNLVSETKLGSGSINTVYKLTYRKPDGTTADYVFKPDYSGRCGLDTLTIGMFDSYESTQQSVKTNAATCDVADFLGLSRFTGRNHTTVHNGRYGMLMELAPGREGWSFKHDTTNDNLRRFSDRKVVGELAKELNDLRWLDIATGQGDRHNGNYMLDFDSDGTPKVTAVDNDMCFTPYLIGVGKFKVDHSAESLLNFKAALEKLFPKTHLELMKTVADNNYVIDTSNTCRELIVAVRRAFGFHSVTMPQQMSRSLCDRPKSLTDPQIDELAAKLRKNIDKQESVNATKRRLKDMRRIAFEYERSGRIVEDHQWTSDKEVLNRELAPGSPQPRFPKAKEDVKQTEENDQKADNATSSILRRDFFNRIGRNLKK